jgi:hypothetical protein
VSTDEGPPQRPPQISPDGKWVWDGTEWQPVAGRQAVFPAFNSAAMVDPSLPTAVQPPVVRAAAQAPVVNYAVNYSTPQTSAAPLWQVKPGHMNKYLYVAAGVVVFVMALIYLNSLGPFTLPWVGTSQPPAPTPAPSLLSARTDFQEADRFVTADLVPPMTSLNKAIGAQVLACNGVLSSGCQTVLVATDDQLKNAHSVVANAQVPACIVSNVGKLKFDLDVLENFMHNALQSFTDSSKPALAAALAGFNASYRTLQSDFTGTLRAHNLYCDTQLTGP